VGCRVEQIAKSLVFRGQKSGRPVLVVASGGNRVDEQRLAALAAEPVRPGDPEFVRARTGFAIGGVPPVGHAESIDTFLDEDLVAFEEVWAAAGTPNAVFSIRPADLIAVAGGRVVRIAEAPSKPPR
jgi:prolyl-tRNA editing enzyme YbaK/EbsC (Cys-tRNA(Pro) deacylase)